MSRKKILVVEDSPSIAELVKDGLTDAGYEVRVAANGYEALRDLEEISPDLIVTDLQMPKVNGLEFCEAIQNRLETRDIPFIILSSLTDPRVVSKGKAVGARYYIAKPFKMETLVEGVKKALGAS